jgi:asparagine synthase (glutamine-hydrolysing)
LYRYFVLIWDPTDSDAHAGAALVAQRLKESSSDWGIVLDSRGLIAFDADAGGTVSASRSRATSCETRLLTGRADGVVFGRVFRRGLELRSHALSQPFDADESELIRLTGGKHLIDCYWGRYVAVVRYFGEMSGVAVVRDPTGGLPCFETSFRGVRCIFSDVQALLSLGLIQLTINWRYVASFVAYSALQIRETGLREVAEVQPGERAVFRGTSSARDLLWSPSTIASTNRIERQQDAIEAVRSTVEQCVHAWASLHRSLVLNLSGGLDSSIVLGCLKSAPHRPRLTCLHYYAPRSQEDEREFARLVAGKMDAELVEVELDSKETRLEELMNIRPFPKPWFYLYDLIHSPVEAALLNDRGATSVFSGAGGDGLFVQARADLAIADFLNSRGFGPGVLRVALDASRINRTSLWPTLAAGIRRWLRCQPRAALTDLGGTRTLVPPDILAAARGDDSLFHVWISAARDANPGLLWQILCMSVPAPFYESFGGATELERTSVLMSQPLMELCLRIPSYVWISGGKDRAVARRAFANVLPSEIVRRTQKGAIDRHNRRLLDENAAFIRETLLDGLMVNAGLLDGDKLARYMSPDTSSEGYEYNEVLRQHLCTEVWLRRWSALTTSAAPSG